MNKQKQRLKIHLVPAFLPYFFLKDSQLSALLQLSLIPTSTKTGRYRYADLSFPMWIMLSSNNVYKALWHQTFNLILNVAAIFKTFDMSWSWQAS